MTYQEQIKAIEDYMGASIGVDGEITKKAEEAVKEMKAASRDLISRQAAIDEIEYELEMINSALDSLTLDFNTRERLQLRKGEAREILNSIQQLPSAQPEPSTEIQEILDYLDNTLHPIVSPDNWNVYAELHDMVSKLPFVQSEHTCVGCKHRSNWENEVEYGYNSPCTKCRRRTNDNYEQ